jgi:hypothetical protein
MKKPICLFAGYLVRFPLGGHVLSQLNLIDGFLQLGYEVVFVEHYGWTQSCYDPHARTWTGDPAYGIKEIERHFHRLGLTHWSYIDEADRYHGLGRSELRQACLESALLFSVGSTTWVDEFRECRSRVYFDIDPGFTQFRMREKPTLPSAAYASPYEFDFHFTIGERIGRPDCGIPTHGLRWRPMRNPVSLNLVHPRITPAAQRFTTVMNWTSYGDITYEGVRYGQKDVELMKLVDLPKRTDAILELALVGENLPMAELRAAGWHLNDALQVTRTVESYLGFIARSRGEFSVAKEAYVKTRCGWFSDRTAAYLASGKPAIVQDTGFSSSLPCGEGLFAFTRADDAAEAIDAINSDYVRHCRAARQIAEEYFDAKKVLARMLQEMAAG